MKMTESLEDSILTNSTAMQEKPVVYFGRILLGEIGPLLSAMRRSTSKWSSHQKENETELLSKDLRELQMHIYKLKPTDELKVEMFLEPFLAIIKSEDTTGPVTKTALAAVNRILSYGLLNAETKDAANAVEAIATAVTHAKFVGTDHGADEVVLWEILSVLRTLMTGPVGHLLTNESVCEILNSSFRICFESRLSELLRTCTEEALRTMIQLLFSRLPQFKDSPQNSIHCHKLKMRAGRPSEPRSKKKRSKTSISSIGEVTDSPLLSVATEETVKITDSAPTDSQTEEIDSVEANLSPDEIDVSHTHLAPESIGSQESLKMETDSCKSADSSAKSQKSKSTNDSDKKEEAPSATDERCESTDMNKSDATKSNKIRTPEDFKNSQGVTFTNDIEEKDVSLAPYGLPCITEVFRFLISLTVPTNHQNTPPMINTSLNLLTLALESGADYMHNYPSLLSLIKDQLCRNLLMNLKVDINSQPGIFMASLRVYNLLFESLRHHLKFQLEMFIEKLIEIISLENPTTYFYKEQSLETVLHLWKIPGIVTELFLNYDCNLYSSDIFEHLTKILSKNAFPVQGLYSTNFLALEALLTVIETIHSHNSTSIPSHDKSNHSVHSSPVLKCRAYLYDEKKVERDTLLAVKETKKLLSSGTVQFNQKPEKGLSFLFSHNLVKDTPDDIALFFRENPHLDKKVMGEYLSKRKNVDMLSAFVKSFNFKSKTLDECLRVFLESFRLPGEAPLINNIIEHFSAHWHSSNGNIFESDDSAFMLAYAIIMLNVDQHNQNAKKQNIPMTVDQFKNNLRGVNNGKNFDSKLLEDIYKAVHHEEIVMPAEQTGVLRDAYLWKLLLRRGASSEGLYYFANDDYSFDPDLFALCWTPALASLSYVYDKSTDDSFLINTLNAFKRCATISARYGLTNVFDHIVISLYKYTTFSNAYTDSSENIMINFARNRKAQMATKTLFNLVISYADILREGWKYIVELLLQLFTHKILPRCLVESDDFIHPAGKISLVDNMPNYTPRVESGLLSSLYSYIALGDSASMKGNTQEVKELIEVTRQCIKSCHPEKIITESAFLRYESLNELLKATMSLDDVNIESKPDLQHDLSEYCQAFLLELCISILIANKDRAGGVWPSVRDHIYSLLMSAAASERYLLLERCVVAILRISKILIRRPELANPVLQSLRILLLLKPHIIQRVAFQITSGIYEVLSLNSDNIQDSNDWAILITLVECAGAGVMPPPIVNPDQETAATPNQNSANSTEKSEAVNDSESTAPSEKSSSPTDNSSGWILVGREGEIEPVAVKPTNLNEWDIVYQKSFMDHKPESLTKAVDIIFLLVREQRVTPINLPVIVQALRTLVEVTLHGGKTVKKEETPSPTRKKARKRRAQSPPKNVNAYDADVSDSEEATDYQQLSEKILDLIDTLHTTASQILELKCSKEQPYLHTVSLWHQALCPALQATARYCCDIRPLIRSLSMTYLHRALINHDLETLSAPEWEGCFNKVIFPLLAKLLLPLADGTSNSLDETRLRAVTLAQKVFLRHLTPLVSLSTFTALWLTFLDFMDKYLHTQLSDHLHDAIPEILKNMLLVMETTQVFHTSEGFTQLWSVTWDRIDVFLPGFRNELFRSHPPSEVRKSETSPTENTAKMIKEDKPSPDSSEICIEKEETGNEAASNLAKQEAARLSLSQESIPAALTNTVILQPPLPQIMPVVAPSTTEERPFDTSCSLPQSLVCDSAQPPFALPHIVPLSPVPIEEMKFVTESMHDQFDIATSDQVSSLSTIPSLPEFAYQSEADENTSEVSSYRSASSLFSKSISTEEFIVQQPVSDINASLCEQ